MFSGGQYPSQDLLRRRPTSSRYEVSLVTCLDETATLYRVDDTSLPSTFSHMHDLVKFDSIAEM